MDNQTWDSGFYAGSGGPVTAPVTAPVPPRAVPPAPRPVHQRRQSRVMLLLGAFTAAMFVALAIGGWVVWQSMAPNPKRDIATTFRTGEPPAFVPSLPDFSYGSADDSTTDTPEAAAAYVRAVDPIVRAANGELVTMQQLLSRWAKSKATDDDVRREITTLRTRLAPLRLGRATGRPPRAAQRGIDKLVDSATDYDLAAGQLLDWLDSRRNASKLAFTLAVGSANVHWDEGVLALYRAGNMPPPELPHPKRS